MVVSGKRQCGLFEIDLHVAAGQQQGAAFIAARRAGFNGLVDR
jgi:hypothetical protein